MKNELISCIMLALATAAVAENPIICDRYIPDPAPYVHNDFEPNYLKQF